MTCGESERLTGERRNLVEELSTGLSTIVLNTPEQKS